MTNQEFAAKLRELAEVYEKNDSIPLLYEPGEVRSLLFCHTAESLRDTIKAFGSGEKGKDGEGNITFTPRRFPLITVYGLVAGLCERVAVGTRVIPAVPERVVPAQPEREETIYETRCPKSLLGELEGAVA